MSLSPMRTEDLRAVVWEHYRKYGRHDLPWRKTRDPYRILVSEVMLQQTQVPRVISKYREFLEKFPTLPALARSSLRDVLVVWQGLGYNRRAKMLHAAAIKVCEEYGGVLPCSEEELMRLPGVGYYTARAVCAFAFDKEGGMVETNIRTVLFHHLVPDRTDVSDNELLELSAELCPQGCAREWYAALMDYGAHLKERGVRLNARSKHYAKQSRFEDSDRQIRGAIVRLLTQTHAESERGILAHIEADAERVRVQLLSLVNEGMVHRSANGQDVTYRL